jgi:hypothetical protein
MRLSSFCFETIVFFEAMFRSLENPSSCAVVDRKSDSQRKKSLVPETTWTPFSNSESSGVPLEHRQDRFSERCQQPVGVSTKVCTDKRWNSS